MCKGLAGKGVTYGLMTVLVAGILAGSAGAAEQGKADQWLTFARETDETVTYQDTGWQKAVPVSLYLDYTLVSDYVWRGINLSEYSGEGGEALNHQMTAGIAVDLEELTGARLGTVGFSAWFEWYADQEVLTPGHGSDNQEIDYVLSWSYDIPEIYTSLEIGYIAYTFPPFSGDGYATHELYFNLGFDDTPLWQAMGVECDGPILNPYFYWGIDVDDGQSGQWMEIGISHDFALAEYGMDATPVLKDITVSPSLVLGIDHRYLHIFSLDPANSGDPDTKLANLNYGLTIGYDLSSALGIPPQWGALSVAGFMNYSQALSDKKLNDEFYGGMTVAWEW
jgi:hypothetical protein